MKINHFHSQVKPDEFYETSEYTQCGLLIWKLKIEVSKNLSEVTCLKCLRGLLRIAEANISERIEERKFPKLKFKE
jgi:hypothetical protein